MKTAIKNVAACALTACAMALFGCTSQPVTVKVKVPVPVACQEAVPVRPVMPTEALSPGAAVWVLVQAALAEIDRREAYEGRLLNALVVCTTPIE